MKNRAKVIFCGLLVILLICIIIKEKNINLEILKNTKLNEQERIEKILSKIDYGNDSINVTVDGSLLVVDYQDIDVKYKNLEKNASILFYLINDLDDINFRIGNDNYSFNDDKVALIYNDYSVLNINTINSRYKDKKFSKLYLGNINGNIDLFDVSDLCVDEYQKLYQDENYSYSITCSSIDEVIGIVDDKEYKLLELLENNKIKIDDLFTTNLKIKKEALKDEDIS